MREFKIKTTMGGGELLGRYNPIGDRDYDQVEIELKHYKKENFVRYDEYGEEIDIDYDPYYFYKYLDEHDIYLDDLDWEIDWFSQSRSSK